jgi:hypothetical protein
VLLAAEEADARGAVLTLVASDGPAVDPEADLVRSAFPDLEVEVVRARAATPVLIGLARCAELVVVGTGLPSARPPHAPSLGAVLAAASEAPVVIAAAPRAPRTSGSFAGAMRSFLS